MLFFKHKLLKYFNNKFLVLFLITLLNTNCSNNDVTNNMKEVDANENFDTSKICFLSEKTDITITQEDNNLVHSKYKINCGHCFHESCIEEYLNVFEVCPKCDEKISKNKSLISEIKKIKNAVLYTKQYPLVLAIIAIPIAAYSGFYTSAFCLELINVLNDYFLQS